MADERSECLCLLPFHIFFSQHDLVEYDLDLLGLLADEDGYDGLTQVEHLLRLDLEEVDLVLTKPLVQQINLGLLVWFGGRDDFKHLELVRVSLLKLPRDDLAERLQIIRRL